MTTLLDHVYAIQMLKAQYCQMIDRAATDLEGTREIFVGLFLPEATANYGYAPMLGAREIADFLCSAIASSSEWALHMLHTPLVRVDENVATGDWTVMAHMKRRESGQIDTILGRYSDTFKLTPQGWRIASVTFSRLT